MPISATPATGGQAFDLTVRFNQNVINALSVAKTPLTTSMTLTSNLTTPGLAIVSLFGVSPVTGSGPLVNITFGMTGSVGARLFAERLLLQVARSAFGEPEQPVTIAVSLGMATYPGEGVTDRDSLLERAEQNLLRARSDDRNSYRD